MVLLKTTVKRAAPVDVQAFGFSAVQMSAVGDLAIGTIRDRVARGLGSDDAPMKSLNRVYAKVKGYRGLPQTRNLMGTGTDGGHMLDNISVRSAERNLVRIDITSRSARIKAAANEKRSPWYGWSPNDAALILDVMQEAARGNIREVTAEQGLPIWMDPLRKRSLGLKGGG